MQVEMQRRKHEKENYEKNFKKAEMEAQKIMMSATDNEIQGLRTALMTPPKPQPKENDQEKEMEQQGFLGTFNQKQSHLKKLAEGDTINPEQKI